jgi:hypothetical protein
MGRYAQLHEYLLSDIAEIAVKNARAHATDKLVGRADRISLRPVRFSYHARRRAARRNVVPDAIDYVLAYGRFLQRTGVTFYFLGRRDLPPADRCASWASRLIGTVVLVSRSGEVITVYRNRGALRAIRRKLKYRLDTADMEEWMRARAASEVGWRSPEVA